MKELSITKIHNRSQKTTKVGDHKIISIVRKNSIFTTKSKQTENTLKEVVMLLSIMKPHHECKYRGFSTKCKPLVKLKNREVRFTSARKNLREFVRTRIYSQLLDFSNCQHWLDQNDFRNIYKTESLNIYVITFYFLTWLYFFHDNLCSTNAISSWC